MQKAVEVVFDYVSDLRPMPTVTDASDHPSHPRQWWIQDALRMVMPRAPLPLGLPIGGLTVVTVFERPTRFADRIVSLATAFDRLAATLDGAVS